MFLDCPRSKGEANIQLVGVKRGLTEVLVDARGGNIVLNTSLDTAERRQLSNRRRIRMKNCSLSRWSFLVTFCPEANKPSCRSFKKIRKNESLFAILLNCEVDENRFDTAAVC